MYGYKDLFPRARRFFFFVVFCSFWRLTSTYTPVKGSTFFCCYYLLSASVRSMLCGGQVKNVGLAFWIILPSPLAGVVVVVVRFDLSFIYGNASAQEFPNTFSCLVYREFDRRSNRTSETIFSTVSIIRCRTHTQDKDDDDNNDDDVGSTRNNTRRASTTFILKTTPRTKFRVRDDYGSAPRSAQSCRFNNCVFSLPGFHFVFVPNQLGSSCRMTRENLRLGPATGRDAAA